MGLSGVGASGGAGAVQAPEQGPATTSTAQDLGDQAKEKVAANAGNIDKGQGEAEKLAAEKKIKSGKAVQGVGIGMTTAAGLMASAATVAAPAFPIGTITAAFVYAASAVLAIVGAVTTFVGNRMIKGGEGALTDSLNTISKGVDKSDSAAKNAKASTREGRRKSFVEAKKTHNKKAEAARKEIARLEGKGELTPKAERQLNRLRREETRANNQVTKNNDALTKLDASDTALGTEIWSATDNIKPSGDLPYNRDSVEDAGDTALADSGSDASDSGAGMNTSTPDASPAPAPTATA
jgi:hypothetical protein